MDGSLRGNHTIPTEIDRMPDLPRHRISHHRRARSDTFFSGESFDDLLLFDPSDAYFSSLDFLATPTTPQPPQISPMSVDSPEESSSNAPPLPLPPRDLPKPDGRVGRHFRSFSVDSDFLDDIGAAEDQFSGKTLATSSGEKEGHHHRSLSMDGATSSESFNIESILASVSSKDGSKKNMGMGGDRLAELALLDPKRAKRILANRQSAARSKERKIKYTGELERKVQTLQNEATTLSAQVTMLQRGTSDLNTENKHLKMRLQALEQQAELRDALNEALRQELNRLRIAAGETPPGNGNSYSRAPPLTMHHQFGKHKNQEMGSSLSTKNGQPLQLQASFMDFTKRG